MSYYETYPGSMIPVLSMPPGKTWQDFWQAYVEHIDEIAQLIESRGMRLAVESVAYGLLSNGDSMLRLIEALPNRKLGFIIDTGHLHYLRQAFPILCHKLTGRIFGTHINYNDGSVHDHNPPGYGNIDWPALLKALKQTKYDGPLDLEINLSDDPDDTYLQARKFLQEKLSELD